MPKKINHLQNVLQKCTPVMTSQLLHSSCLMWNWSIYHWINYAINIVNSEYDFLSLASWHCTNHPWSTVCHEIVHVACYLINHMTGLYMCTCTSRSVLVWMLNGHADCLVAFSNNTRYLSLEEFADVLLHRCQKLWAFLAALQLNSTWPVGVEKSSPSYM